MSNPFRYFNSSPEIIRLAVLMYVKYPLSLRNVEMSVSSTRRAQANERRASTHSGCPGS